MRNIVYLIAGIMLLGACAGKAQKETPMSETKEFQEEYRLQVHFSPGSGWMNDPNGMVYYDGEYHLFYQHYPEDKQWGPMHWGHAISTDLMNWEHQPIALYPDERGYIFSGSAVVDWKNTSGFGSEGNPPLIAFFTYHNIEQERAGATEVESQAVAYSLDKGRMWTKYDGNPVLREPAIRDFRDPKVFWHEPTSQWIMSVASGQVIRFYASKNCLDWHYLSEFGEGRGNHDGVWECPDLFPLNVEGTMEEKWVLIVNINPGGPAGGSATQYFVGEFDGKQFRSAQKETRWMDYGKDNYAGVTWSDAPDNRRILIGWMNNWQYAGKEPTASWSGGATLPREMGLVKEDNAYLLTSTPVKELDLLKGEKMKLKRTKIQESYTLSDLFAFDKAPLDIKLVFDQQKNTQINFPSRYGVRLKNDKGEYILVGYDNIEKIFYIDRTNSAGEIFSESFSSLHGVPYTVNTPEIDWHLVIDVSSVEFFAAGNRVVITDLFYPSEPFQTIELFTQNGIIDLVSAEITELQSIYQ